ncbi:MAG: hypothetical protein IPN86_22645 [Saprospiraceae bacterium]|nr:hypothetical protein [Saprospiraceae bacterium]
MYRLLIFFSLVTFIFSSGCYYDSEEDLYPAANCSTDAVSFANDIQPIINNSCIVCHSTVANLGNITLEGHTAVLKYANDGTFLGSVKHLSGYSAMPQGSSKINDCSIAKIESWINAGSPNN